MTRLKFIFGFIGIWIGVKLIAVLLAIIVEASGLNIDIARVIGYFLLGAVFALALYFLLKKRYEYIGYAIDKWDIVVVVLSGLLAIFAIAVFALGMVNIGKDEKPIRQYIKDFFNSDAIKGALSFFALFWFLLGMLYHLFYGSSIQPNLFGTFALIKDVVIGPPMLIQKAFGSTNVEVYYNESFNRLAYKDDYGEKVRIHIKTIKDDYITAFFENNKMIECQTKSGDCSYKDKRFLLTLMREADKVADIKYTFFYLFANVKMTDEGVEYGMSKKDILP